MVRLAVMTVALALMPPACAKLMGKHPSPTADPEVPAPVPITSATTPPIWHAPEVATEAPPTAASAAAVHPVSGDLLKARAAAEAKDFKKVRSLLEKKVRAGKSGPEEAQLAYRACVVLKDKACSEAIKAKHPADVQD